MNASKVIKPTSIKPSIKTPYGTYYPSGHEWLLCFAYAGCEWAIKALIEEKKGKPDGKLPENH